jgi:hypothetical protein
MKRSLIQLATLVMVTTWASASPRYATIPGGSQVAVRITENLSSGSARVGQVFHGTLQSPIASNGRVLYPKGSQITGKVTAVHRSGRLSDPGVLELTLVSVSSGKSSSPLNTQPFRIKGESHTKSNVTKIGGTAAAGTIMGAIFGGGKGAAIGAGVGAAAGTGIAAATGKKEATVESEAVLPFVTAGPVNVASAQAPPVENQMQPAPDADEPPVYRRREHDHDDDDDDQGDYRGHEWRERHGHRHHNRDEDDRYVRDFNDDDRRMIRSCYSEDYSNLPPGLAKRGGDLPPGLERHIRRDGTLPPGLQKRVRPLPESCERRLPPVPAGWFRVALSGRILLLDGGYRIMDMFYLRSDD